MLLQAKEVIVCEHNQSMNKNTDSWIKWKQILLIAFGFVENNERQVVILKLTILLTNQVYSKIFISFVSDYKTL